MTTNQMAATGNCSALTAMKMNIPSSRTSKVVAIAEVPCYQQAPSIHLQI